ncbi:GldG family protein [uncultured Treponema sp.]|uniref:GldG family protein n=1 Tax=uncultured Treponema sp. TaxID=162155 RepID=UPI0025FB308B|nr:GldG family protein [uncultured Treponema sp.]
MKRTFALYRAAVFSYLIDPLFYASALLTIFFTAFRFFFARKFFVSGLGSSDLRPFFNAIPYVSILVLPLLSLRLRSLLLDDSLPVSSFKRFLALNLAAFSAFMLPVLLLLSIPLCVNVFGSVDFGQCFSGFIGIFFYGFCSICMTNLLYEIFAFSAVFPLLLSSVILALVNFLHLLPLYFKTGEVLSFLCRKLSFAWHFDSFGKGILDSRNFFYYIILSFILILLSVHFEFRRLDKRSSRFTTFLITLILIFTSISVKNLYFRLDISAGRQFSLSKTSRTLISELDGDLRITYFRSKELKNLYPQTDDVLEFLSAYAQAGKNISLTVETADPEKLKALGSQGQQIKNENGTKTEFVTVYSAVLLQYLEKSSIIPFVLSTSTLEYDLTVRMQQFLTQKERKVYLLCGNGRNLSESYMYVEPWLSSRGFSVESLNDFNSTEVLRNLRADDELVLFGTKNLSMEQSMLIQRAVEGGTKLFVATSPFHTMIEDEWKVTKNENDSLISFLNGRGFAFENSLVEDISCHPIMMESGSGSNAEYATVNYPLWLLILSQKNAKQGLTLFWASPIVPYGEVEPLLFTTNLAWCQLPAKDSPDDLFLTNPFLLPKTASASDSRTSQFVVAARDKNISLVSDQFFVSSLMTGFISGESSGDFRNYDYLTKELFILRGEEELASLMEKSAPVTALHKITGEEEFEKAKKISLAINFVFLPLLILSMFVFVILWRKSRNHLIAMGWGE